MSFHPLKSYATILLLRKGQKKLTIAVELKTSKKESNCGETRIFQLSKKGYPELLPAQGHDRPDPIAGTGHGIVSGRNTRQEKTPLAAGRKSTDQTENKTDYQIPYP
jgi:hypothetical protein